MDEDESLAINRGKDSSPFQMNRGFELLLRDTRREPPKSFQVKLGKMVSLFRREFHFSLDFHIIRKKDL